MRTLKTVVLVLLLAVVLMVMIQNAQPVTFRFLNWQYQVSQLLVVVIVFVLGWIIGFVGAKLPRKKKEDEPPLTPRPR